MIDFSDIIGLICMTIIIVIEIFRLVEDGLNYDVLLILILSVNLILNIIFKSFVKRDL